VTDEDAMMRRTASGLVDLGRLCLDFGRVDRATFHPDGCTPESDTDHTVMLGLIACSFAELYLDHLDVGLVAQYALVHDLVEVYAGDTPTLRKQSDDEKRAKAEREHAAYWHIAAQFGVVVPWVPGMIAEYEAQRSPEARYVKALDKLLPKITHILNDAATIRVQGVTEEELHERYEIQFSEMMKYAADFPAVFQLRDILIEQVMTIVAGDQP